MEKNLNFKRVLIINNYSMFEQTPVAITLKSFFNNWPDNHLLEIYRYSTLDLVKTKKIKSFCINEKCLPIDSIIRKLVNKKISPQKHSTFNIMQNEKQQTLKKVIKYFTESLFICKKKSGLYKEIKEFNPQVIYTIGESLFTIKAVLIFSKKFNIPVVIHYMDNWRDVIYPSIGILKLINFLFKINLRRLEKRINNVLVISPKMKEEYSKENANIRYHVLLNSVNYIKEHVDWQTRNQIIFAYIGGLHLNRWESLLVLEKCISELNKLGINSRIYVYTPENDATLFSEKYNSQYTIFKGFLPHDKIWMAYKNADIFIHIESFNNKVTKYTKYSISTKIPECMAEGKPILCFAPNDLAVAEYINSTKVGISVDNYDDLLEVAINLSTNINLRKELGTNGIKTVMTSHTQDRALKLLVDVLQPEER